MTAVLAYVEPKKQAVPPARLCSESLVRESAHLAGLGRPAGLAWGSDPRVDWVRRGVARARPNRRSGQHAGHVSESMAVSEPRGLDPVRLLGQTRQ